MKAVTIQNITLTAQEAETLQGLADDPDQAKLKLFEALRKGRATPEQKAVIRSIVQHHRLSDRRNKLGPATTKEARQRIARDESKKAALETGEKRQVAKMVAAAEKIVDNSGSVLVGSRRAQVFLWSRQLPCMTPIEMAGRLGCNLKVIYGDLKFIEHHTRELCRFAAATEEERRVRQLLEKELELQMARAFRDEAMTTRERLHWTAEIRHQLAQMDRFMMDAGFIPRVAAKIELAAKVDAKIDEHQRRYRDQLAARFMAIRDQN